MNLRRTLKIEDLEGKMDVCYMRLEDKMVFNRKLWIWSMKNKGFGRED